MKTLSKNNAIFDFFKMDENTSREPTTWEKTIYGVYKIASLVKIKPTLLVVSAFILGLWFNTVLEVQMQSVANQSAEISKISATKDEQKRDLILTIPPDQMASLLSYVETMRNKEIEKLIEIYYTGQYNTNEKSVDVSHSAIRKQIQKVNEFSFFRQHEMSLVYTLLKRNKAALLDKTYDNALVVDKILAWEQMSKNKELWFSSETSKLYNEVTRNLQDPAGLAKFLQSKKDLILSHEGFE